MQQKISIKVVVTGGGSRLAQIFIGDKYAFQREITVPENFDSGDYRSVDNAADPVIRDLHGQMDSLMATAIEKFEYNLRSKKCNQ